MAAKKILIASLIFIICCVRANGQVTFVKQIGCVAFNGSSVDRDSLRKENYALLVNEHIQKNYSKKKLPLIYLVVCSMDSMHFQLAYDNLNGNSLDNKTYDRKGKYDTPGLRIKICSQELHKEELLKLLDYGIVNLKELKKMRNDALSKDHYDQPETLSLSRERILEIINKN